jgi:hypothetical protein
MERRIEPALTRLDHSRAAVADPLADLVAMELGVAQDAEDQEMGRALEELRLRQRHYLAN